MNQEHYDMNNRPLVPQAERPFIPEAELESVQETVWFNPTDKDCILDLYIGTKPRYTPVEQEKLKRLTPQRLREYKNGTVRWIIRKGETRSIPSEFDMAIQHTTCTEPDCMAPNRIYCRDNTHHSICQGGLGPQLINKMRQYRPLLAPALQEDRVTADMVATEVLRARQIQEAADAALMTAQLRLDKAKQLVAEADARRVAAEPANSPAPQQAAPAAKQKKEGQ